MTTDTLDSTDVLIEGLQRWLPSRIPGARELTIADVQEPSQGFSSKTLLFTARWREDGQPKQRALVARIQRATACPMLADVFHQVRVIEAVAAHSAVKVPPLFAIETDAAVLGAPFYLMDRVEGRVPPDRPSYHAEGWFADLPAARQSEAWWNAIGQMAQLHRIGWQPFPFLMHGENEPPGAGFYLRRFIAPWFEWAAQGRSYPLIEATIRHMLAHQPPLQQPGLVWNDARMGNTMFAADGSVASLFDFEVATMGPAEVDLGWWLYAEDLFSAQFGVPRAPGIPARAEAIAGFERLYGRPMPHFDYYETLAALKHAVITIREYSNGKKSNATDGVPPFAAARMTRYLDTHSEKRT